MKSTTAAALLLLAATPALSNPLHPRQEDSVFEWVNFSAQAVFKGSMEYNGDVSFGPYSAHCHSTTTEWTGQCSDSSGITNFPVQSCENGSGSNDGGFSWQLNMASSEAHGGPDGWNLEVTATGVNGDDGDALYGCQYFPRSDVVCNNTNEYGPGVVQYLNAPETFTMQFQTTSGCAGDYFTKSATTAVPMATATAA